MPDPNAPDGPYYDDLVSGHQFVSPPAVTADGGLAAAYQAIAGEALPLCLDARLAAAVTGDPRRLVSPGLLMHLSIGASTVATRKVLANLFYRNVRILRPVREGETLHTVTRVLAMADGSTKPGRAPRGKALLGITTTADDEPVVDYERCPLIRLRGDVLPGHRDDLGPSPAEATEDLDLDEYLSLAPQGWNLDPLGPSAAWEVGETRDDPLRDAVDQALALVRLTHNQAAVHRDVEASPYPVRLVYGGHTVALAQASLSRMLSGVTTVLGWHGCDHTAPVFEGDLLSFRHTLIAEADLGDGAGRVRAVRVEVSAHRPDEGSVVVLDWTPILHTV